MSCLSERFFKFNLLTTLKAYKLNKKFLGVFLLVGLFSISNEMKAQNLYESVNVNVTRANWNYYCADGVDLGPPIGCQGNNGPDLRYIYSAGIDGAGFSNRYLGASNSPTSGGPTLDNRSDTDGQSFSSAAHNFTFSNFCGDVLNLNFEAWEEDIGNFVSVDCPSDGNYVYNGSYSVLCTAGGDGDDNRAVNTALFDLQIVDGTSAPITFIIGGGFSLEATISWDIQDAPSLSSPTPTACVGDMVVLNSSAPNGINQINWFTNPSNPAGTNIGSGVSITSPLITSLPVTFYAAEFQGGCYGDIASITITESATADAPTVAGAQTCLGGSVTLTATSATPVATFTWYDNDPLGPATIVGTGPDFTTPPINIASEDWFVTASDPIGCESAATQVVVTTDLPLVAPVVANETICEGYQITLNATSGGANSGFFNWYSDAGLNDLLYVGNPFATPNLTSDATYYVTEDIDDCITPTTVVTVSVTANPASPIPDEDTLYTVLGGTVAYSVSTPALGSNEVYRWYDEDPAFGGSVIFEGGSFTSPPITVPIEDFFVTITDTTVDCSNGNLREDGTSSRIINSGAARVVAIAADLIAPPVTINDTICQGETAELTATADSVGAVIVWFSSGSAADSIATGNTYTTPILAQNTTYYAGEYIGGLLISELAAVIAVVNPKPTPPQFPATQTVCESSGFVTFTVLDEQVGDQIHYILINTATTDTVVDNINSLFTTTSMVTNLITNEPVGEYLWVISIVDATTGCESDVTLGTVIVVSEPEAPTVTGDIDLCEGESTILTATGTGGSITWYSDAGLATIVGNGAQFVTPALSSNTSYYVTEQNDSTSFECVSPTTTVDITVNTPPVDPIVTNDSICAGETATLEVIGSMGTMVWYTDAGGNDSVGTGSTFITPILNQTTTYFVGETDGNGCQSNLIPVVAFVNPNPTPVNAPTTVIGCTANSPSVIINFLDEQLGDLLHFIMIDDATGDTLSNFQISITSISQDIGGVFPSPDEHTLVLSVIDATTGCESDVTIVNVSVIDAPPAPTVTGDTEVCMGHNAILNAPGEGGIITWYNDAGLTTIVATGSQFITGLLTSDTTFYVTELSDSAQNCESAATTVDITVSPRPADPVVTNDTVCFGETATLEATAGQDEIIIWLSDASGNDSIGTGTTFTTQALTQTTAYYVVAFNTITNCFSEFVAVYGVVLPSPTPPVLTPVEAFCEDTTAVVTVTVTVGANAVGYTLNSILIDDNSGDTVSNQSITIAGPTVDVSFADLSVGTYTHYANVDDGTCASIDVVQSIIINEVPDAPTVLDSVEICYEETATLFAFGQVANPNSIITWFDDTNFDPIAVGWEYETQPLIANQTFYAHVTDENGCISELSSVTVVVNPIPADPVGTNDSVCFGSPATLTVAGSGGLYTWYSDGAGTNAVATGETYTTPNLSQNTTYYVGEANTTTGCESNLIAVTGVVIPGPDAPTPQVGDITICVNDTGVISATGSGSGVLIWYDANVVQLEIDSMPPATGEFTVGPFATAGTYFYYVTEFNGECESPYAEIEVVVTEVPEAPVGQGDTICVGESATIMAIGTGGVINWYADAALTIPLSSGSQYVTDVLDVAGTYSYYATESYGFCEGPATEVEVVVNPLPETPTVSSNAPICEGETLILTASNVFGVTYEWTGPNGFTSTDQNPVIVDVSEADHQGVYSVVVTDIATGCESEEASTYVDILPTPEAPSLTSNSPLCEGEDLLLTASVVDSATYTFYDASYGVLQTGSSNTYSIPMITLAQAGIYGVSVTIDGCESAITTTEVIVKPRPDAVAVSNNGPLCEYAELNVIAEVVSGATYTWIGPDGNPIPQNGPIITIDTAQLTDAGTYGVFITVDGCASDTATTVVVIIAAPVLSQDPTTNSPICEHDTLLLQAPYDSTLTYSWTKDNDIFTPDTTYIDTVNNFYVEAVFDANENDHQGFYTLVVTDEATGCSSKEYPVFVMVNKFPDNIIADNNGPACEGEDVQLSVTSIVNATYTWTGPNNYVSYDQNPILENVDPDTDAGVYEVTIELGGCVSVTVWTEVVIYRNPIADAGIDFSVEEGTEFQLDGNGSVGAIDFAWVGEDQTWFDDPTSPNPWITPLPARDDPYVFVLTVYSEYGCTDQDTVLVTVYETLDVDIPNIITPNGDGINDTWVIGYLDNLDNYVLSVYARGGTLIFKTSAYNNDWDGTKEGTDLPEGTYWYTLHSDNQSVFKGFIEIVR